MVPISVCQHNHPHSHIRWRYTLKYKWSATVIVWFTLNAASVAAHAATLAIPQIAAGTEHALALKSDGSLWAWGSNRVGVVGDGTSTMRSRPVQVGTDFIYIAAGGYQSFAVKWDGSLWAWGMNNAGQLGDGTTENRSAPVKIGSGFVRVATAGDHTVALKADGSLWFWGARIDELVGYFLPKDSSPDRCWIQIYLRRVLSLAGR